MPKSTSFVRHVAMQILLALLSLAMARAVGPFISVLLAGPQTFVS